ncbi:uncharacterized protein [Pleurodeles waltl]|uniref:uncharacterized protein n=1 Tax=Pleurodeles waltl TaxID=8319 RepID=UPI003709A4B1
MGFQEDPEAEAVILQPSGVSSGAVSAPMDLCDSQDFRGASECEANAENITEEREPLEGSAPKEGIPGIEMQDVYELQPGYICIGRLIFVLVKERIAEIQPVTLRCLNISEPSALLQCNCHECIAKWCINGRLNASVKCWALDKDHKRKLRLSPETGVHEALENMTVDYLTNKGSALSYLELYELLNYISILSVQSYRRGEREVMSRAIESIAIKISMFVSLRVCKGTCSE